jgi:hypothetical protein
MRRMAADEQEHETVPADELARLRRIEEAARKVLAEMEGRPSATTVLTAIAELRAAPKPS